MKIGNLKIGARLQIGFLLKILLILIVGIEGFYQMRMVGGLMDEMYDHPVTVGQTARDIRAEINAMRSNMTKIMFLGDSSELPQAERSLDALEKQILAQFKLLRERFLGSQDDVERALKTFEEWKELRNEVIRSVRAEGKAKIDRSFYLAQERYVDDLIDRIQTVIDFSAGKLESFRRNAAEEESRARGVMIALLGVTVLLGLGITLVITRSITPPLRLIVQRMKDIAAGDLGHDVEIVQRDEIGELAESFREMQASLRNKAEVAAAIATGDFGQAVKIRGGKDQLGNAINRMTESLQQSKAESDLQDWVKTGKNELNRIIVGEGDLGALAKEVISFLASYLGARIGTLYVMSDSGALTLRGSYAFSKRKSLAASIEPGEGLVGQAALEKEMISITSIPDDYIRINSSLGDSPPRNLIAAPFIFENSVKGVMELGSFEEFTDRRLDFIQEISDSIGIAINTVQNQNRLKELLDETQRQARQLQVQEEELRAANEELEEQTSSLRHSEDKLRQQQEELQVINEELEEKNDFLEKQKEQIAQKNRDLEDVRRELERRASELEVTSKYKSEFLANMSHELRTPLNSILLLSRDLADNSKGNLNQPQVESATIIQKSGNELLQLIDEILDLSKVEAGRMTLKLVDAPLREVAAYVDRGFKRVASEKGLVFNVVMEDSLPESIRTDRQRLEQILKNLLSNALKFTEEGSVTLEIHRPALGTNLSRSGLSHSKSVAFSVKDTGIGISPDKQMPVFEAFQQVDGGASRKYGGTGLGLSISRELAKLLGGEIQLSSSPGEGSTFTLFLPLENAAKDDGETCAGKASDADRASPPPSGSWDRREQAAVVTSIPDDREVLTEGDRSILIVEDDPGFATILMDQCHAKGFKALVSATGEEGLTLAESLLPVGIILDIKLPGMNGWTVLNALKANPSTRHIPVHIMSVEETAIDALQKGAIGFLTKPVAREGLEEAFKRIEEVAEKKIKDLLIVEDNPNQRVSVVNLIADMEVNIVEAESGEGALAALRGRRFDCMILDLGLPDMSGFDLLKKLGEGEGVYVPPVIVYTGKDLTREEEMELRNHAESIIIKGVRSEERLLDEAALFLHKSVSALPPRKREMIINLHDRDAMLAGRTILLVDDDMRNLFALSKILSEKGMNVLKAEDGRKAMTLLEQHAEVDLVLLDIMMPVMDGYETAREIRKQRRFHNLPIIALTAKAMKGDRDRCIAAGASDYLSKPVDVERLLSVLRVWLYKRPGIL